MCDSGAQNIVSIELQWLETCRKNRNRIKSNQTVFKINKKNYIKIKNTTKQVLFLAFRCFFNKTLTQ